MEKAIRTILNISLSALLIFAAAKFTLNERDNKLNRQECAEALQIALSQTEAKAPASETPAKLPDDPISLELLAMDMEALQAENKDVIGWIYVPDSKINYPLLQAEDNSFYLNHSWKQSPNAAGAIFMDCKNRADFSQFNTIIYGHNIMAGDMFASLHSYRNPDYLQRHPSVYIRSGNSVLRFDVYAAQLAGARSIVYGLNIESEQNKEAFLNYVQASNSLEAHTEDSFLTLSTCADGNNKKRMVVIAVLNEENSYIDF